MAYLRNIQFRRFHVFQEGNRVTYCLATPSHEIGIWKGELPCTHYLILTIVEFLDLEISIFS